MFKFRLAIAATLMSVLFAPLTSTLAETEVKDDEINPDYVTYTVIEKDMWVNCENDWYRVTALEVIGIYQEGRRAMVYGTATVGKLMQILVGRKKCISGQKTHMGLSLVRLNDQRWLFDEFFQPLLKP